LENHLKHIEQNRVSFFQGGIRVVKPTTNYTIHILLSTIKSEKYKSEVEKLRAEENKSIRAVLKKDIDYVTWSGTFINRNNNKLLEHSNFICIDFDELTDIENVRKILISDLYTFALFLSPSGNGLKVLVIIDGTKHTESYLELEKYYLTKYGLTTDKACKDVARACFMSYDPELYVNSTHWTLFEVASVPVTIDQSKYEPIKRKPLPFKEGELDLSEKVTVNNGTEGTNVTSVERPAKLSDKELTRLDYIIKQIEDAKLDVTSQYDDWQRIAFAISTLGEWGRDYFHRISLFNPGYELKLCDEKYDNALKTRNRITSRNPFYRIVEDYGINSKPIREVDENKEGKMVLPDDVDEDEWNQYGFFEWKNMYWSMSSHGGKYAVSNFTMEILFHVKTGGEEAYRLMKIKNIHGFEAVINMNTDDFVSLSSFKKLIARRGNYLWKGKEEDLTKLQDKLQREERATELIDILGFHSRGQFYAFANGLIDMGKASEADGIVYTFKEVDEYGIVHHANKNYFIPMNSKIYADKEDLYYNYKKFVYKPRELSFQQWWKMFYDVYGENGKTGMVFYVASLFSDIIYKQMGRRFPILCLYGQRGSGKGTFAESIMSLFGEPQEQIMLGGNTTQVGFMRTFAQFRNAIVWLDEYKNNLPKKTIEAIKNIFDRIGYKRGKKDHTFEVDYVPIHSACILSGQEMPTIEPALFTRVLMNTFTETKHNEESRKVFRQLMTEQEKGLSHITVYLLRYGDLMEKKFKETFEEEVKMIHKEINNNQVEERMINNYACLSAVCKILLEKETLGFKHHGFRSLLVRNMSTQHAVLQGSDDTTKFWQVVESLFNQGLIVEDRDFELADGKLYIRIQNVAGLYEKELRARNDPNALQKSTLENYLQIDKSKFVARKKRTFRNGSYTWCMIFNYRDLDINLIRKRDNETAEDLKIKYREMGIDTDGELSAQDIEERDKKYGKEMGLNLEGKGDGEATDDLPF
jgi:hypothetical protein